MTECLGSKMSCSHRYIRRSGFLSPLTSWMSELSEVGPLNPVSLRGVLLHPASIDSAAAKYAGVFLMVVPPIARVFLVGFIRIAILFRKL